MAWVRGRDALCEYVAATRRFAPGLRLEQAGPVLRARNCLAYRWRIVSPDGTVLGSGWNFSQLSARGLFASVVGLADAPAADTAPSPTA
jgi:hypothetical protein